MTHFDWLNLIAAVVNGVCACMNYHCARRYFDARNAG